MLTPLLNHLWQSTLVVIATALLVLALRNNGARVRYWLWMTASLKFILPLSLLFALGNQFATRTSLPAFAGKSPGIEWTELANTVVQPAERYVVPPPIATSVAASMSIVSIESIVVTIWAMGVIAVAVSWLLRWFQVRALLRNATPLDPAIATRMPPFPVPIKAVVGKVEPGIVGIRNPVLLIPHGLCDRLSRQQLRAILAHEQCHLERRDNLTAAIHMVVEALFWFHPLVWWVGARLVEERERACDAAVLRGGNDPEVYAEGILDVCQHYVATPIDCMAGVSGADLKKRVRAIMLHRGEARVHFGKWLLLASVAVSVISLPVLLGALTPTNLLAQSLASSAVDETWPAIESATIALSQSNNLQSRSLAINPNGVFATRNTALRQVIAFAYQVQTSEILERSAPLNDIVSSRFDILAQSTKAAGQSIVSEEQHKLAVRRLLAEQFGLQFHFESMKVPAFALSVTNTNAGLKQAAKNDRGPQLQRGINSVRGYGVDFIMLKQFLSSQLQRPIVDLTGLTGTFNFRLSWGPEPSEADLTSSQVSIQDPTRDVLIAAVQQQLGLSLLSQDSDVNCIVVDRVHLPATLTPNPTEVTIPNEVFDRYVGHYEFPASRTMSITRDGDRFLSQVTGQRPVQLYAESEHDFFAKIVRAKMSFVVDANGQVTELVLKQDGHELHAPRMDESAAQKRQEQLAKRIREKIAAPNSEAALRSYFASLDADQPAFDLMTDAVAAAVRAEWPGVKGRYIENGPLKSLSFERVTPIGTDVYLATFEHAELEWSIGFDANGKIDRLNYGRMPAR